MRSWKISTLQESAIVAGGMLAVTIAITWPVARDASQQLPGGLVDPLFNTFILAWDADRVAHGLHGFWDAPFFFPLKGTLAFSEHLLGIAMWTAPLQWVTRNPLLVYNLAFLGSYVLSGVAMYGLARSLWGRRDAAWLAALSFAFNPYRFAHVTHLQMLVSGWMPVSLAGWHRYVRTQSRMALCIFAAAYLVQALSNGYLLYFFAVPVTLLIVDHVVRIARQRDATARGFHRLRPLADLTVAGLAVAAILAPFAAAYLRARDAYGLRRSVEEIRILSASVADYWHIPFNLRLWAGVLPQGDGEHALFPGIVVSVLAAIALVSASRKAWYPADRPPGWGRHVGLYGAVLGLAVLLSLGPAVWGPYRGLLRLAPGFDGVRVPARFAIVAVLALSLLAAAGAAWLFGRLRPATATVGAVIAGVLIVLEGRGAIGSSPFPFPDDARRAVNQWIRTGPPGGVLELPAEAIQASGLTLTYEYNTLLHRKPIVNGYSGYPYDLQDYLADPQSPLATVSDLAETLRLLREIGVGYLLVHRREYGNASRQRSGDPSRLIAAIDAAGNQIAERREFDGIAAWRLRPAAARPSSPTPTLRPIALDRFVAASSSNSSRLGDAFDGDIETRWTSGAPQRGTEWIRVTFDRDYDVGLVRLETGRYGRQDYPRRLVIESDSADGPRRILFDRPMLMRMIEGVARDYRLAPVLIELPANRTRTLWIRQAGQSDPWQWSVHELSFWERSPA